MWPSLLWLTLFQLLAALQLAVSAGASVSPSLFLLFPGLPTVMWTYYLALRRCGARGFEMETIAFFLSTLSLAVTASSAPGSVLKQFIAILLGLTALVVLGVWLRDTSRTRILDCSDKKPVPRYRPFLLITSTRPPFSACPSVAVISAS